MTNNLYKREEAEEIFLEYEKHRNNKLMQDVINEKVAEGKLEGRIEGLLDLIRKKVAKGKTVEQIADELEKTVENIQSLMEKINSVQSA